MIKRNYTVLADDPVVKDTLVFVVQTDEPSKARARVNEFYEEQGWEGLPKSMVVFTLQNNKKIALAGHTRGEYQKQQEKIITLCKKILEIADGADLLEERDQLYEYVKQFPEGEEIIKKMFE